MDKMDMKLYFAPLEGITGYVYRQAFGKYYGGVDAYFTPFISPAQNKSLTYREWNDVLPEHNEGLHVIPQILTNKAEYFIRTARELQQCGYEEVNLNLGCPSGTVTAKGKGAGFLAAKEELAEFLDEIFTALPMKISIKTRIGVSSSDEFPALLEIFDRFPVSELMIHPRLREDFYNGRPDMEAFGLAYETGRRNLCYNGDINTAEDYERLIEEYPNLHGVMIGRGLLKNPVLAGQIKGGQDFSTDIFLAFQEEILRGYERVMSGDRNTLFKMKELWFYFISLFPGKEKEYKKLKKAGSIREYEAAVRHICL